VRRRLKLAAIAVLTAYLALVAEISCAGARTHLVKADCILVPGARVLADGTPGPSYQARLDRAFALYKEGWAPWLVFTGGPGASGPIESEVGRKLAMAAGVPPERILTENVSHDTWENFHEAAARMREHNLRSCLIVTDPFHSQRCQWIARDVGLEPYPAPSQQGPSTRRPGSWLYYTSRECVSTALYFYERCTTRPPQ